MKTRRLHPLRSRRGAVLPLFAIMLPVLLLLAGFAVNLAYMQLTKTELQTAADASARAAGRALSVHQSIDVARQFGEQVATLNRVAGQPFNQGGSVLNLDFGEVELQEGGRLTFKEMEELNGLGASGVTSVRARGNVLFPLLLRVAPVFEEATINRFATVMQADRDICLVLDRSGSMTTYKDEAALIAKLNQLYSQGKISKSERNNALNNYSFSNNLINRLSGDMKQYGISCNQFKNGQVNAPIHSRWWVLEQSLDAFLDVIDETIQDEQVAVASFSTSATTNLYLTKDMESVSDVYRALGPNGYTAIGQGMQAGAPTLQLANGARPFATQTLVVMTDGINNRNPLPVPTAQSLVANSKIVIHTITFTPEAQVSDMQTVASIGGGKHYHANSPEELVDAFREIARDVPVIIVE